MKALKLTAFLFVMMYVMNASKSFASEPLQGSSEKYQKDNTLIRDDITAVNLHKEQIRQLKEKDKTYRSQNQEQALIMNKRELEKRKADLKRSEVYLAADRKDLKSDYKLSFKNRRDAMRDDQANIDKYKDKLDNAIEKGNEDAITSAAKKVAYYQGKLKNDKAILRSEQHGLDSNLASIDKQIKGNSVPTVALAPPAETAYAATNGKMYK